MNEFGSGLVLPIAKAYAHLTIAFLAIRNGWEVEPQTTRQEINDAITHLGSLQWPEGALTRETIERINMWRTEMSEIQRWIAIETLNGYPDDAETQIRSAVNACTAILNRLDLELTGTQAAVAGDYP